MRLSSRLVTSALCGALLLLGLELWPGASEVLRFSRPAYLQGAPWQLLTSQLVHLNWPHASVNAFALAASLIGWSVWVGLRGQLLALAGGLLGVAAVLAFDADCAYYAGLSGALHGLWAGNAGLLVAGKRWSNDASDDRNKQAAFGWLALTPRSIGACMLLVLLLKLWLQHQQAPPDAAAGWLGIADYRPAHWAGLAGGLTTIASALLFRAPAAGRRQRQSR